ncbi:MAG: hypothetical protein R2836_06615 [Chitinophagales bacterium]|nr:hypothetical protein [Bacteroidota bacterium]MCB9225700.1 hypothetical protein [Chitinophagales bacterium]
MVNIFFCHSQIHYYWNEFPTTNSIIVNAFKNEYSIKSKKIAKTIDIYIVNHHDCSATYLNGYLNEKRLYNDEGKIIQLKRNKLQQEFYFYYKEDKFVRMLEVQNGDTLLYILKSNSSDFLPEYTVYKNDTILFETILKHKGDTIKYVKSSGNSPDEIITFVNKYSISNVFIEENLYNKYNFKITDNSNYITISKNRFDQQVEYRVNKKIIRVIKSDFDNDGKYNFNSIVDYIFKKKRLTTIVEDGIPIIDFEYNKDNTLSTVSYFGDDYCVEKYIYVYNPTSP